MQFHGPYEIHKNEHYFTAADLRSAFAIIAAQLKKNIYFLNRS